MHSFEEQAGRGIVDRERALYEGIGCERNEPDAIPIQVAHQPQDPEPSTLESVGGHILSQHGAGQVHGDDDVLPHALDGLDTGAELGACEGHHERPYSHHAQGSFPAARGDAHGRGEFADQVRISERS